MIIPSIQEIRELDQKTIELEPIASIDLMERASKAFAQAFQDQSSRYESILVFCGPGNNGGDGLAITRILGTVGGCSESLRVSTVERGCIEKRSLRVPNIYLNRLGKYFVLNEFDCQNRA